MAKKKVTKSKPDNVCQFCGFKSKNSGTNKLHEPPCEKRTPAERKVWLKKAIARQKAAKIKRAEKKLKKKTIIKKDEVEPEKTIPPKSGDKPAGQPDEVLPASPANDPKIPKAEEIKETTSEVYPVREQISEFSRDLKENIKRRESVTPTLKPESPPAEPVPHISSTQPVETTQEPQRKDSRPPEPDTRRSRASLFWIAAAAVLIGGLTLFVSKFLKRTEDEPPVEPEPPAGVEVEESAPARPYG
jgi:hypothetical protein